MIINERLERILNSVNRGWQYAYFSNTAILSRTSLSAVFTGVAEPLERWEKNQLLTAATLKTDDDKDNAKQTTSEYKNSRKFDRR